eukprot:3069203-Rhodomonas_salina.1
MADEDREGSPGRAMLDAERPMSLGERQTSNSLSSLGSDVLKMMKDAGLDAPTTFFNTIEEKE